MSDAVIKVESLGKKYTIGHQSENGRYTALRDVVVQNARRMWQTTRDLVTGRPIILGDTQEEVWALKDVSFEVKEGEVVGIIGRNGAGKSTLLKILTRITEPTEGRVRIRGRVASLLEVGTGFHPELTGRENIFLNGAVLGMTRAEIKSKFDEIVAFAEVEKFIDTPVKRYSSGMYVRLAFAVAAHLEPEILLVDEVLAVGDAAFQKKCLGKMGDVAKEGRTVLFVSHNMAAIRKLCTSGIVLDCGFIVTRTSSDAAVRQYLELAEHPVLAIRSGLPLSSYDGALSIAHCEIHLTGEGEDRDLSIEVVIDAARSVREVGIGLRIMSDDSCIASLLAPSVTNFIVPELKDRHRCVFRCEKVTQYLSGGRYILGIWLSRPKVEYLSDLQNVAVIELPGRDVFNSGTAFQGRWHGLVPLPMRFSVL